MTRLLAPLSAALLVGSLSPDAFASPDEMGSTVAVMPPDLGEERRAGAVERITNAVVVGLERGGAQPHPLAAEACPDGETPCFEAAREAGAEYLIQTAVVAADREYELTLRVWDVEKETELSSGDQSCDICGLEEAANLASDEATTLARRVATQAAELGQIILRSNPEGAMVEVDGEPAGLTPLTLELEAGAHQITLEKPGYSTKTVPVQVESGLRETLPVELHASRERSRRIAGWSLLGASVPVIGGGVAALAVDGRPHRKSCGEAALDANGLCPFSYETTALGAVTISVGAAALISGVTLLVIGKRSARLDADVAVRIRPSTGGLRMSF